MFGAIFEEILVQLFCLDPHKCCNFLADLTWRHKTRLHQEDKQNQLITQNTVPQSVFKLLQHISLHKFSWFPNILNVCEFGPCNFLLQQRFRFLFSIVWYNNISSRLLQGALVARNFHVRPAYFILQRATVNQKDSLRCLAKTTLFIFLLFLNKFSTN